MQIVLGMHDRTTRRMGKPAVYRIAKFIKVSIRAPNARVAVDYSAHKE